MIEISRNVSSVMQQISGIRNPPIVAPLVFMIMPIGGRETRIAAIPV